MLSKTGLNFFVSPTGGEGETKGSKWRPSVVRPSSVVRRPSSVTNVKVYLQDSLMIHNLATVTAMAATLG